MRIQTLQNSSVTVLTDAFNQAFSDYIVPLKLTDQAMKQKILCDQIDLNLSPGFFIEQKLCGFILHGVEICNGKKIAWNGGTGVIPSCRKQGITAKLYDFILPQLSKIGIAKSNLEVIQSNQPAIHIYRKIGFENVGELLCYKGNVSPCEAPKEIALAVVEKLDWDTVKRFWSWVPTFQNREKKIEHLANDAEIVAAVLKDSLVGYIAFSKKKEKGDVYQFAVDRSHRRKGIGRALFATAMVGKSVPLSVVNIDSAHLPTQLFLETIGLQQTVKQWKMALNL